jgi:hypothetical protein
MFFALNNYVGTNLYLQVVKILSVFLFKVQEMAILSTVRIIMTFMAYLFSNPSRGGQWTPKRQRKRIIISFRKFSTETDLQRQFWWSCRKFLYRLTLKSKAKHICLLIHRYIYETSTEQRKRATVFFKESRPSTQFRYKRKKNTPQKT